MSSYQGIAPSSQFVAFTKSDSAFIEYNGVRKITKAVYVGGTGDMAVKNSLGTTVLIESIPAGTLLPICVDQILSTNTSASKFIAIF
ncbi:hypothetical protein KBA63_00070 [Candidatus Woesebacteria bacterium]|nr:hypothetical protein [Candidatus Woesebacteria bacterium]